MRAGGAARVGPESMVLPVMLPLAASIADRDAARPQPEDDRRHTPLRSRLVSRKVFSGRRGGDLKFTTDEYCVSTARPLRTSPGRRSRCDSASRLHCHKEERTTVTSASKHSETHEVVHNSAGTRSVVIGLTR